MKEILAQVGRVGFLLLLMYCTGDAYHTSMERHYPLGMVTTAIAMLFWLFLLVNLIIGTIDKVKEYRRDQSSQNRS